jgi:hypothetical protein
MRSLFKRYAIQFCLFCTLYAIATYTIDHIIMSEVVHIKRLMVSAFFIGIIMIIAQISIDEYTDFKNNKNQ